MKLVTLRKIQILAIFCIILGSWKTYSFAKYHEVYLYLLPNILLLLGWVGIHVKYFSVDLLMAQKEIKTHDKFNLKKFFQKYRLYFIIPVVILNSLIFNFGGHLARKHIIKGSYSLQTYAHVIDYRYGYRWEGPKPYVLVNYRLNGYDKTFKKILYNKEYETGDSVLINIYVDNPKIIEIPWTESIRREGLNISVN